MKRIRKSLIEKYVLNDVVYEVYLNAPGILATTYLPYLVSLGSLSCFHGYSNKSQPSQSVVLLYLEQGSGSIVQNGAVTSVNAGDAIFLNCKDSFVFKSAENSPIIKHWMIFEGNGCENLQDKISQVVGMKFDSIVSRRIAGFFSEVRERLREKDPQLDLRVFCWLYELLIDSVGKKAISDKPCFTSAEGNEITKMKEYLDQSFLLDVSIERMANDFHRSVTLVIKKFKEAFGFTPYQYVIQKRLQYASGLLHSSDLSLKEIADISGFRSEKCLSAVFKRLKGCSPGSLRSQTMFGECSCEEKMNKCEIPYSNNESSSESPILFKIIDQNCQTIQRYYNIKKTKLQGFIMIQFIKEEGEVSIKEKKYFLKPGSIFLALQNEEIEIKSTAQTCVVQWISFQAYEHRYFFERVIRDSKGVLYDFPIKTLGETTELQKMILHAIVALASQSGIVFNLFHDDNYAPAVSNALIYVNSNYNNHFHMQQLSLFAFHNVPYRCDSVFRKQFKRLTGYSPYSFVRNYKLEISKILLEDTNYTLEDIAKRVGYKTRQSFEQAFFKTIGMSPGKYRRESVKNKH